MADNFTTKDFSGASITGAADEIASVKYPRVKMVLGADGTNDGDVSSTNPMPVSAAALPLPSGAATAAKQPAPGTAGTASADVVTVQGIASMTALKTDGSAVTQPVSGTVTANAGTGTFAVSASALPLPSGAATAAKQPALGTAGSASADVITVQGVASMTALKVDGSAVTQPVSGTVTANLAPTATGGLSLYRNINVGTTGANVKGSAGQLYGYYLYNNGTVTEYVKLYDKSSAPTVGTDTPVLTLAIPAGSAANAHFSMGIAFSNGIGIGGTTAVADASTAAPASNDLVANLFYK